MKPIAEIQCFLLDMDGTIYLSDRLIPGALRFFERLEEEGKEFVFITNNSSKGSRDYQRKLKRLGIEVSLENIVNSGEVTASHIKEKKGEALVYLVGTPSLEAEFKRFGLRLTLDREEEIDYLVLGFDTTLNYQKLWDAHDLILQGVPYIATHPDYVCPLDGGRTMPDCGAVISFLKTSTGREPDMIIGKPNSLVVDYVAGKKGISRDKLAVVGDRLYTDIQTGINAGITSILVLSGETKRADLDRAPQKPDYVFESIKNLCEGI